MSRFARDSLWLGISTAVAFACGLIGQPILNRYLGAAGRGLFSFLQTITTLGYSLLRLGTNNANAFYSARGEPFWSVAVADFFFSLLASAATALILAGLLIFDVSNSSAGITSAIVASVLIVIAIRSITTINWSLVGRKHFKELGQYATASAVSLLVARVVLVPWLGVTGALLADAVAIGVSVALMLRFAATRYGWPCWPTRGMVTKLFRYGIVSTPGAVATVVTQRSAVLLLFALDGDVSAGIFSAIVALTVPFSSIARVLGNVLRPRSSVMTTEQSAAQISRLLRTLNLVFFVLTLGVLAVSYWVLLAMGGPEFMTALGDFRLLLLVAPANAWIIVISSHFLAADRPSYYSIINLGRAFLLVGTLLALVPVWGFHGAVIAECVSILAVSVLSALLFIRSHKARLADMLIPRSSDVMALIRMVRGRLRSR